MGNGVLICLSLLGCIQVYMLRSTCEVLQHIQIFGGVKRSLGQKWALSFGSSYEFSDGIRAIPRHNKLVRGK